VTSAFGEWFLLAKYLNLLQRMLTNQHERIRNITALSGHNPEAVGAGTDSFSDLPLVIWIMRHRATRKKSAVNDPTSSPTFCDSAALAT
jgi:hypothetical protein